MRSPDGIYDWLAAGAAALGVVSLLLLVINNITLRRLRRAQKYVLAGSERDIVQYAADLQREFVLLRDWIDESSETIDARMKAAEARLDGSVAHTAMLRYDAYGEMTGRQSSSVALVDDTRTGVIITAIRHRSHSHLYVKQLQNGESDIELSPEEQQVLSQAFSDRPAATAPPAVAPQPPRGPAGAARTDTAQSGSTEVPKPASRQAGQSVPHETSQSNPPEAEPRVSAGQSQQIANQ